MNIGVCKVRLRLPENQTLKGKRQILKSITERVKNRYNVSIAEVGDQELWQLVTLGITCVSTSAQHANQVLSKVVDFIEKSRFDVELLDYEIEILHAL
ncbi:MAG: DUF503 domain-containing protein [Dehalococcoidia bacterium]|nr:MAG: DUF503 domain-containing protein [Dehalococcoidia bacterium]